MTIEGVTVTGGVTVGNLTPFSGRGGGICIPRAAGPSTGAVTIRNSVIRGNSVAPGWRSSPTIRAACSRTPAAWDLQRWDADAGPHEVSDNRADAASGLASNAIGGGILNRTFGNLTLKHSVVTDNHVVARPTAASPTAAASRWSPASTSPTAWSATTPPTTSSAVPTGVEQEATAGGIQIQGNGLGDNSQHDHHRQLGPLHQHGR